MTDKAIVAVPVEQPPRVEAKLSLVDVALDIEARHVALREDITSHDEWVLEVKNNLFLGENPEEGFEWLDEQEKAAVCRYIVNAGDMHRIAEDLKIGTRQAYELTAHDKRPWVFRAIRYYMTHQKDLRRKILETGVTDYLAVKMPELMASKKTPAETKRKIGRDIMEASGYFPKYPDGGVQTNVQINIPMPTWGSDKPKS